MILDGRGISEQAVDRYQGRKGRKEREQSIERHPGCDGEDAILVHLLVDAPENVLPALSGISVGERLPALGPAPGWLHAKTGLSSTALFPDLRVWHQLWPEHDGWTGPRPVTRRTSARPRTAPRAGKREEVGRADIGEGLNAGGQQTTARPRSGSAGAEVPELGDRARWGPANDRPPEVSKEPVSARRSTLGALPLRRAGSPSALGMGVVRASNCSSQRGHASGVDEMERGQASGWRAADQALTAYPRRCLDRSPRGPFQRCHDRVRCWGLPLID